MVHSRDGLEQLVGHVGPDGSLLEVRIGTSEHHVVVARSNLGALTEKVVMARIWCSECPWSRCS